MLMCYNWLYFKLLSNVACKSVIIGVIIGLMLKYNLQLFVIVRSLAEC